MNSRVMSGIKGDYHLARHHTPTFPALALFKKHKCSKHMENNMNCSVTLSHN